MFHHSKENGSFFISSITKILVKIYEKLIAKLIKKICWYPRDSYFLSGKYFVFTLIRYWLFLETLIRRLPIHRTLLKRDSNRGVNIVKFLGTAFSMKHLWWLLLNWPLDFLLGKDQLFSTCKILVFHSSLWNYRKDNLLSTYRSSRPEVFYKTGVLRNFAKYTGEHLCQSLFFNRVVGILYSSISNNSFIPLAHAFNECNL